jgi:hypothetical protein
MIANAAYRAINDRLLDGPAMFAVVDLRVSTERLTTMMKMIIAMSDMSAHVPKRAIGIADDRGELVRGGIDGAGLGRRLEATDPRVGDQEANWRSRTPNTFTPRR